MRILVIGNCQAASLAAALTYLTTAEVCFVVRSHIVDEAAAVAVRDTLDHYDLVLSQPHKRFRALRPKIIEQFAKQSVLYPRFWFTGFHPDAIAVIDQPGFSQQLGGWHSVLALAAYVLGKTPVEARGLFTKEVFQKLGFFEAYQQAERAMQEAAIEFGFDFEPIFSAQRGGLFANTPSHPHLAFVTAMAEQIVDRCGISRGRSGTFPSDPLAGGFIYPVYSPLASALGMHGSWSFKNTPRGKDLTLEQMLDGAYAAFMEAPDGVSSHPRVAAATDVLREIGA